ncbi:uncharacterized protein [Aegilops tauschii subsp. strangulata]|uniref:uncharacterized protein isoform X4 n=1 Tax=Aegilops tauschii subsp. strangulata TaxID=200361 RepID=UPI003CC87FF6
MPPSRRVGKAASEPQKAASEPRPAVGFSSSARDAEAASATSGWTPGGGTAVVNVAAQDVRTRLQSQAAALRQFTDEFLATRAAIRDYHNLRAAAFNFQARELTQKTADLTESRAANASLRAQLWESQTALRAKDAELAALVQERDRLVKKLADQEEGHKAALKAVQDREATLQAEFETEAAGWAEARQTLVSGYGQIEDLVDGIKGLSGSSACRWYIDEDPPEMNAFRASLAEGLPAVTAHIPGEQAIVPAPVHEPPVELTVQELLALDPFDNLKKQFIVKVTITGLGSDNRWWFLSCRKCHKTAYTSGWQYRCSDYDCSSIIADPSYYVCTFESDGANEAEFMFFDRAAKQVVGKPLMTLIHCKYPGFTSALDLAQIGGSDVGLPVEISRLVTQKYRLVVSISNKNFQPASTQLSFQVGRIDETFKPDLVPFASASASSSSGASSSAKGSDMTVPIPTSFSTGSSTLVVLPLDEMNTPISAFKGKGQAIVPKTPSRSPCPKSARRKLLIGPPKSKGTELPASVSNVTVQAGKVVAVTQTEEVAATGNVVQPTPMPTVRHETETTTAEDPKIIIPDPSKAKRTNNPSKGAGIPKKLKQ